MRAPLFAAAAVALLAHCWLQWSAPAITIIGNVTVDTFSDGSSALGGAVSYAAAVASGFGQRACIVSAHGPDAQLGGVFEGHDLVVVPSNRTLVFEHSYTFWGNHRRLRVAAQPDVTLTWDHVPARCRRARVLLLGPLMPEDMHPASFVPSSRPWWERALGLLGPRQQVGLMAQGLQRQLEAGARVAALPTPSHQLEAALGPSTLLFLSDVEADGWGNGNGTVAGLAARTSRFLVTRGGEGADEWTGPAVQRHPVFDVPVVDTNGAGDVFATSYMLAAAAGHSDPVKVAHWAGAMAVSQPQACKPACVTDALRDGWQLQPPSRGASWLAVQERLLGHAKLLAQLVGWGRAGSSSRAA
ncbi:sugar kinase [Micractinium conductrix]|uniref:Sugar kinase n=1 Tax=Micractinium conductrix TaxID=554055 RepID=A0A2P6VE00_9CHLO|nr:sugar kinase [Micractinium conductrix]|eukprot:PSC72324.1 sugar kinase [Micractinium conductrix]